MLMTDAADLLPPVQHSACRSQVTDFGGLPFFSCSLGCGPSRKILM